jgi:putative protease
MNMIAHVAALAEAGISSFKIEGRAKTFYYTAVTANAYRNAVDGYVRSGYSPDYVPEEWVQDEMNKISHRPYGTGFYFGMPSQHLKQGGYIRSYEVAAVVEGWEDGYLITTQRNRFYPHQELDVLEPGTRPFTFSPAELLNEAKETIESANHPMMRVYIPFERPLETGTLLRCKKNG